MATTSPPTGATPHGDDRPTATSPNATSTTTSNNNPTGRNFFTFMQPFKEQELAILALSPDDMDLFDPSVAKGDALEVLQLLQLLRPELMSMDDSPLIGPSFLSEFMKNYTAAREAVDAEKAVIAAAAFDDSSYFSNKNDSNQHHQHQQVAQATVSGSYQHAHGNVAGINGEGYATMDEAAYVNHRGNSNIHTDPTDEEGMALAGGGGADTTAAPAMTPEMFAEKQAKGLTDHNSSVDNSDRAPSDTNDDNEENDTALSSLTSAGGFANDRYTREGYVQLGSNDTVDTNTAAGQLQRGVVVGSGNRNPFNTTTNGDDAANGGGVEGYTYNPYTDSYMPGPSAPNPFAVGAPIAEGVTFINADGTYADGTNTTNTNMAVGIPLAMGTAITPSLPKGPVKGEVTSASVVRYRKLLTHIGVRELPPTRAFTITSPTANGLSKTTSFRAVEEVEDDADGQKKVGTSGRGEEEEEEEMRVVGVGKDDTEDEEALVATAPTDEAAAPTEEAKQPSEADKETTDTTATADAAEGDEPGKPTDDTTCPKADAEDTPDGEEREEKDDDNEDADAVPVTSSTAEATTATTTTTNTHTAAAPTHSTPSRSSVFLDFYRGASHITVPDMEGDAVDINTLISVLPTVTESELPYLTTIRLADALFPIRLSGDSHSDNTHVSRPLSSVELQYAKQDTAVRLRIITLVECYLVAVGLESISSGASTIYYESTTASSGQKAVLSDPQQFRNCLRAMKLMEALGNYSMAAGLQEFFGPKMPGVQLDGRSSGSIKKGYNGGMSKLSGFNNDID